MNIFRLIGDTLHLVAIVILLVKMLRQRSAAGLSLKTQFLFALVFTTRYLDIFTSFISVYNTVMKIFFLTTSWHICYLMRNKSPWKATYDHENDTFRIRYLLIPCAVLALLVHSTPEEGWVMDVLWSFSQYLEAVAILPQIFLLEYTERYEALTSHYLAAMGAYRFFYIIHWIYRYVVFGRINYISVGAGILQTVLYVDFFYHYLTQVVRRAKQRYDLAREQVPLIEVGTNLHRDCSKKTVAYMNNYQIYDEVGKGRYSSVYKGRRKKTIDYYAISSIDKSQRHRVLANVKFLRSANHPRVIKFHNWYETNNHLWVITELCSGGDLRQVLNLDSRLSEVAVRMYAGDIAEGLMYIHSRGVVYGNMKPSNILMDSTMAMRFYDFSLSNDFALVKSEVKLGTPLYMAPEIFTRDGVLSMASDLWSFGILLYEMSTGKPPFEGDDLASLLTNIMFQPYLRNPKLSDSLNDLLESLLVKNPTGRATWEDVQRSEFWQGRLQLPMTPFPPQPAFDEYKKHLASSEWPSHPTEVRRNVEWAIANAKRNIAATQSNTENGPPKSPTPTDEVDFADWSTISMVDSGAVVESTHRSNAGRESSGSNSRIVDSAQSQFHRHRERVRHDGAALPQTAGVAGNSSSLTPTVGGDIADLRIDELLLHSTDSHIRPLVMNNRIERFVEQKYDIDLLGFDPPAKSQLKTFNEERQAQFITLIYRTLSSSSLGFDVKLNVMCYFESVCADASIANFIVNSSIMTLCLKMVTQRQAPSNYRATAASIMSILVRHATFIHPDLAKANIISTILKNYGEEDSPRVKRKLVASLGEFLIYIAVQNEPERAVWGIEAGPLFAVYRLVMADADDVVRHYGVRTLENLVTVNDKSIAMEVFANPDTVRALLAIYALPPSPTRGEHMRTSALATALKLAMMKEELMPIVFESSHLRLTSYGKILSAGVSPKAAQSLLTFLNMVIIKCLVVMRNPVVAQWTVDGNVFSSSHLSLDEAKNIFTALSGAFEDIVAGLCNGCENTTIAIKGKTLLFLVLVGCADERILTRLCTSQLVTHVDNLLRDKDTYVQRCAACIACYLGVFLESQLAEVSRRATPASLQAVCQLMSSLSIMAMIHFSDAVFVNLGQCVEKALSPSRHAAYEEEFNQIAEILAQSPERTLRHRSAVASAMFPPYLKMLDAASGERRFAALRILSAFVAPLDDSALCGDTEAAEGRQLDHVLVSVAAALSALLREKEPVPVHAVRLLTACGERRPAAFAGTMTVALTGELVAYMVRSRQSDVSAPLRLLTLALQTARAAELMEFLAAQDFCLTVLLKTLTMAVAKEVDHLLEPCCELAAFFLRYAVANQSSRAAQQSVQLLPQQGLCSLWLPLCASSSLRSVAENAAACVYGLVRISGAAQEELLSEEGVNRVREIIINTRDNPTASLHVIRALGYACERCSRRDVLKVPQPLVAALQSITCEGNYSKEIAAEAAATVKLIRREQVET